MEGLWALVWRLALAILLTTKRGARCSTVLRSKVFRAA